MRKVIFTNGCFDILHTGHVQLLAYCYRLAHAQPYGGQGEVVVGLNSDSSVKRLKGDKRPINSEQDRAYILESLRYVDRVEIFDEDTPYRLINDIIPSIIVKGGDYTPADVVGSDVAEVKIFNFVDGYSTTGTINKL
tara:strand:+ start:4770 stop:5180 length:411 start_codon:yes stop_codon:yes gene_type:complete